MAIAEYNVQQQGRANGADGVNATAAMNRGGAIHTSDPRALYDQWLRAGKIFEGGAAPATTVTVAQNASFDLTSPSLHIGVPSSKVFVPIKVSIQNVAVWTTADGVVLYTSDTSGYTSGGVAMTMAGRNMAAVSSLDSALGVTAASNLFLAGSTLVAPALTNPRIVDQKYFVTGGLNTMYEYNILKGDPMVMVHGPGSFLAAVKLAAASATCLIYAVWAELDKSELVNS